MIVWLSSLPIAFMCMVVCKEMWNTTVPIRGCPLMSDPSMHIQFSGINHGVHGSGRGGALGARGSSRMGTAEEDRIGSSSKIGKGRENV
jgi:hypothetical protein